MRTEQQELMKLAYEKVAAKTTREETYKKTYGIWCHSLPGMISQCGLAQAVAFLEAKSANQAFVDLKSDLGSVIGGNNLTVAAFEADLQSYMRATDRVQKALVYFKRFSVSLLGVEAADDREGMEP